MDYVATAVAARWLAFHGFSVPRAGDDDFLVDTVRSPDVQTWFSAGRPSPDRLRDALRPYLNGSARLFPPDPTSESTAPLWKRGVFSPIMATVLVSNGSDAAAIARAYNTTVRAALEKMVGSDTAQLRDWNEAVANLRAELQSLGIDIDFQPIAQPGPEPGPEPLVPEGDFPALARAARRDREAAEELAEVQTEMEVLRDVRARVGDLSTLLAGYVTAAGTAISGEANRALRPRFAALQAAVLDLASM
jgi:hypothetical protein